MTDILQQLREIAGSFGRSLDAYSFPEKIVLKAGAQHDAADFAVTRGYRSLLLVADATTFPLAAQPLITLLSERDLHVDSVVITTNPAGDVVADEASVVEVLMAAQFHHADVLIAVGAGTLHDVTRYAAYSMGIPFLSVPTAPSVDGFTSKGAPLIIRGNKITVPAIGPDAIFADLDLLCAAPQAMIAAGFADMLGKTTSLFDWQFGILTGEEPADPLVEHLTQRALATAIRHVDGIGRAEPAAIAALTAALIESGLAMLILGQSHPASGAEHHLSHHWEMAFLRDGRRQQLHGAKVGVACCIIADLYRHIGETGLPAGCLQLPEGRQARAAWPRVQAWLSALPDSQQLATWLQAAGGPTRPEELGIGADLVEQALREAHAIRPGRKTLLRLINEGR